MQAQQTQKRLSRVAALRRLGVRLMAGVLIVGLPVAALAAFGNQFETLKQGMSVQQVEKVLGGPNSKEQHGEYLIWRYDDRQISDWASHRSDYFIVFKGDKVLDYGVGDVRAVEKNGVITIVPANQ